MARSDLRRRKKSRFTVNKWFAAWLIIVLVFILIGIWLWVDQNQTERQPQTQTRQSAPKASTDYSTSHVPIPFPVRAKAKLTQQSAQPRPKYYHSNSQVVSPDLRKMVTADNQGKLRIWDLDTGEFTALSQGHQKFLSQIQFSPDGRFFATASVDETARVWDIQTGQPVSPILRHNKSVTNVLFFTDGQRILTCDDDALIRQWDIHTGQCLEPTIKYIGFSKTIKFLDDETKVLVSGGYNAQVFDLATAKPVTPLIAVKDQGASCDPAMSHDGTRIAFGWHLNYARIWDLQLAKPISPKFEHQTAIRKMAFSSDDSLFLTVDYDQNARLWDAKTGKPVSKIFDHVRDVMFIPNTRKLLIVQPFDRVVIWDVDQAKLVGPTFLIESGRRKISRDGRYLLNIDYDMFKAKFSLLIWDLKTGISPMRHKGFMAASDPTLTREIGIYPILHATFNPDGQHVLTAGGTSARVWELKTGQLAMPELKLPSVVTKAVYSPDGSKILVMYGQKFARLFDANTGKAISPQLNKPKYDWELLFTNDSKQIIAFEQLNTARIWDTNTGQVWDAPLQAYDTQKFVSNDSVSQDGKWRMQRISQDRYQLRNISKGEKVTSQSLKQLCRQFAFSPDSRFLAVAFRQKARVWDIASDTPLCPELNHPDDVTCIAMSPDGKWVLTGCEDGQARLWDIQTGKCRDYQKDLLFKLGQSF